MNGNDLSLRETLIQAGAEELTGGVRLNEHQMLRKQTQARSVLDAFLNTLDSHQDQWWEEAHELWEDPPNGYEWTEAQGLLVALGDPSELLHD